MSKAEDNAQIKQSIETVIWYAMNEAMPHEAENVVREAKNVMQEYAKSQLQELREKVEDLKIGPNLDSNAVNYNLALQEVLQELDQLQED